MIRSPYELSNYENWTTVNEGETFLEDVALDTGIELGSIGKSYEDRELYCYDLGNGDRTIIISGGVHGTEPGSREMVLNLARDLAYQTKQLYIDLLNQFRLIIIPTVNPDHIHITRPNAQFININRDMYLLETPEGQALASLLAEVQPEIYIDFHERSGELERVEFINPMNLSPNASNLIKDKTNEMTDNIRLNLEKEGYTTMDYPATIIGDAMSVAAASYLGSLSFTPETHIGVSDKSWRTTALQKVFDYAMSWFLNNQESVLQNLNNFNEKTPSPGEIFTLLNGNEEYYHTATRVPIILPNGYQLEELDDFQKWIDVYNFEVDENGFIPINQKYGRLLPRLLDPESSIAVTDATRIEPDLPERRSDGRYTKALYDEWREIFIKYM